MACGQRILPQGCEDSGGQVFSLMQRRNRNVLQQVSLPGTGGGQGIIVPEKDRGLGVRLGGQTGLLQQLCPGCELPAAQTMGKLKIHRVSLLYRIIFFIIHDVGRVANKIAKKIEFRWKVIYN